MLWHEAILRHDAKLAHVVGSDEIGVWEVEGRGGIAISFIEVGRPPRARASGQGGQEMN